MYEPGKFLRTGGPLTNATVTGFEGTLADDRSEIIDFSGVTGSTGADYSTVDAFTLTGSMQHSRHYHNLVTLPSGHVVAVSGNTQGNSNAEFDHFDYECEYDDAGTLEPIAGVDCSAGCPTLCHTPATGPSHCTLPPDTVATCPGGNADCALCQGTSQSCDDDSDCAAGVPCVTGMNCQGTHDRCDEDSDCAAGVPCVAGPLCRADMCVTQCSDDAACPGSQICRDVQQSQHDENVPRVCLDPCTNDSDCADNRYCSNDKCDPANNECFFVEEAELFTPGAACGEWVDLPDNRAAGTAVERMYHATALLLPDGGILSTGGGGRTGLEANYDGEFLYVKDPLSTEALRAVDDDESGTCFGTTDLCDDDSDCTAGISCVPDPVVVTYGTSFDVSWATSSDVARLAAVRLSATTHGYDQDSRRVPLSISAAAADQSWFRVEIPEEFNGHPMINAAPPGPYMLFALNDQNVPVGEAAYIRLCDAANSNMQDGCEVGNYVLEAGIGFTADEVSCNTEPVGGTCPTQNQVTTPVTVPTVSHPTKGTVNGWHVTVPPGMVRDPANPTTAELAHISARGVRACQAEWADPAITQNCASPGALLPPVWDSGTTPIVALDLIHLNEQQGQGIFPGESTTCDLGSTCYTEFDEDLRAAVPLRPSAAGEPLYRGEEYRLALGPKTRVKFISGSHTKAVYLDGEVGYSFCKDGNAATACPFYLGSLLAAQGPTAETVTLQCADGTTDTVTLSGLTIALDQPAWGIDQKGTIDVGFPSGSVVLNVSATADGAPVFARRANESVARLEAKVGNPDHFRMLASVQFEGVPCGASSTASVTAELKLFEKNVYLHQPPDATITLPNEVLCLGQSEALTANVSDVDGDLSSTQWIVDGVLLAPYTTSIPFTGPHTVEVRATDGRGGVTTDKKDITCAAI